MPAAVAGCCHLPARNFPLSRMTSPAAAHSSFADRPALAIALAGRLLFAFIALAYFVQLPSGPAAGWGFDPVAAVAGLVLYLLAQLACFVQARSARVAAWAAPVAVLADALAAFACLASDPSPLPPTLALVLVAALHPGLQGGWMRAAGAIGGAMAVTAGALLFREQELGVRVAQDGLFMMAALLACLAVFVALALRRDQLQKQAARYADMETQLLNRRGFDNAARYLVPLHQRTQLPLVIVLVSLDSKSAAPLDGSTLAQAVKQIGFVVRQRARRSDVIARLSPDEFIFMLFDTPMSGAETLARALVENFNAWLARDGVDARATFGLVNMPEEPVAIEQLVARARSAVQRAQKHPSSPAVVTAPSL